MNTMERLKKIKEHFENISMQDFELNLEKAGMGIIKPSDDDIEMLLETDVNGIYYDSSLIMIKITPGDNLFPNDFEAAA